MDIYEELTAGSLSRLRKSHVEEIGASIRINPKKASLFIVDLMHEFMKKVNPEDEAQLDSVVCLAAQISMTGLWTNASVKRFSHGLVDEKIDPALWGAFLSGLKEPLQARMNTEILRRKVANVIREIEKNEQSYEGHGQKSREFISPQEMLLITRRLREKRIKRRRLGLNVFTMPAGEVEAEVKSVVGSVKNKAGQRKV